MPKQHSKQNKINLLASSLVGYLVEEEHDDFVEWFAGDGWDERAVCKALGVRGLSEDFANSIATSAIHDTSHNLVECLAYHTDGEHIYADVVKLAVLLGEMKKPVLNKAALKAIKDGAND
ncbi:MAG: hypothetical protein WC869_00060 [Phycisphaerae bacterium]|jgi:hypothetical protein